MIDNATLLGKCWLEGSNDFQQRVPDPSQHSMAEVANALLDPYNNDIWNEFIGLMNMIGQTYIFGKRWENPLAILKKERMYSGSVREIAVKWMKAHSYDIENEQLLKVEKPEYEQWFQSVNRKDYYKFTWERPDLRKAILEDGEYGLNRLLAATMDAMFSSDNYDEMNCMLNAIALADKNWDEPIFRQNVSEPVDETTGKAFLAQIRSYKEYLRFPSQLYNSLDVPVWADPSELILICEAGVSANIDVYSLASIFNLEKAEMQLRKIVVPQIPINGCFAMLTTVDFFETRDFEYGVFNFFDVEKMANQNYLHHWESIGCSPYVPCILFGTFASTNVPTIEEKATALDISFGTATTIYPGQKVKISAELKGTVTANDCGIEVKPDSCLFTVAATQGTLDSKTYVDRKGYLHLQPKGIEAGDTITVTAVSTYINPDGGTAVLTDSATISVIDEPVTEDYKVQFSVAKDTTLGTMPTDAGAVVPSTLWAVAGTTVTLPAKLTTEWETSDGTSTGTAGTWTFTGWSSTSALSDTITSISNIAADKTVYGGWAFVAD